MDIQLPQILFQIVNFSVVLGALTYLLYKPIQKIFRERSERIDEAQKAAEVTLAERDKLEAYKKKVKQEAERQAAEILEKAAETAKQKESKAITEARAKAQTELAELRQEWQRERTQLLDDARKDMVTAVIATAEKVLKGSLDAKAQSKLIDQELEATLKAL